MNKMLLVRLYNRLSFVMCNPQYQNSLKDIDENISIKELQQKLDEVYANHMNMKPIKIIKVNYEKL